MKAFFDHRRRDSILGRGFANFKFFPRFSLPVFEKSRKLTECPVIYGISYWKMGQAELKRYLNNFDEVSSLRL